MTHLLLQQIKKKKEIQKQKKSSAISILPAIHPKLNKT